MKQKGLLITFTFLSTMLIIQAFLHIKKEENEVVYASNSYHSQKEELKNILIKKEKSLNKSSIKEEKDSKKIKITKDNYTHNLNFVTAEAINVYFENTYLNKTGYLFIAASIEYGIDPGFLAGIAKAETGGNSELLRNGNNAFGIKSRQTGTFKHYKNIAESIFDAARLLSTSRYYKDKTVWEIHQKYCPPNSDEAGNYDGKNKHWSNNVVKSWNEVLTVQYTLIEKAEIEKNKKELDVKKVAIN